MDWLSWGGDIVGGDDMKMMTDLCQEGRKKEGEKERRKEGRKVDK